MPNLSVLCNCNSYMLLYMPAIEAQLISTERFCVNISSGDDDDHHEPNVSGDARRAQEEANDNAAAQEKDGGMEDDPEDDDMGTQGYTSGNVSEEEDNEWDYRGNDMAARDTINSQRMAICMDEPREAQYMAGFIALQMSRLWGVFEAGEKRAIDAALKGALACPYYNDLGRYPNITEFDRDGIVLSSTEHKISQSQNVRTRTFRTVEERNQYICYLALKCEGLYIFYKLWIAARILDITKEEMKLLVSERRHPVGDIVYRCFSLAFNCKYISFARTGLNLGRHGYVVNVSAIIAPQTRANVTDLCSIGASGRDIGLRTSATRSMPEHETPNTTWTRNSVDVSQRWP